jgi:hypothetical protein
MEPVDVSKYPYESVHEDIYNRTWHSFPLKAVSDRGDTLTYNI